MITTVGTMEDHKFGGGEGHHGTSGPDFGMGRARDMEADTAAGLLSPERGCSSSSLEEDRSSITATRDLSGRVSTVAVVQ
jgi:hypothetical protein